MRFLIPAVCIGCLSLHASILPTFHLQPGTLKVFQDYISNFEKSVYAPFASSGKMWIDDSSKRKTFEDGKTVVEPRRSDDIPNGSLHHFSGSIRVPNATIESVRRIMTDYGNYPKYFKPDVSRGSGTLQPDSTPTDEHFHTNMQLVQNTLWIAVTYDTVYDTHYRRLDKSRWTAHSSSISIRELRDPKDASQGYFPEGDDHGFLWKTNTYWFARERNGGLDLQVDSITISRPIPTGFGWWGTRRTRDAVDKMLRDTKAAIEAQR